MRNLKKSLDKVTVCLKKIETFLSCYFFLRTPWKILSGRGRLREFGHKLWTYIQHLLVIVVAEEMAKF